MSFEIRILSNIVVTMTKARIIHAQFILDEIDQSGEGTDRPEIFANSVSSMKTKDKKAITFSFTNKSLFVLCIKI